MCIPMNIYVVFRRVYTEIIHIVNSTAICNCVTVMKLKRYPFSELIFHPGRW